MLLKQRSAPRNPRMWSPSLLTPCQQYAPSSSRSLELKKKLIIQRKLPIANMMLATAGGQLSHQSSARDTKWFDTDRGCENCPYHQDSDRLHAMWLLLLVWRHISGLHTSVSLSTNDEASYQAQRSSPYNSRRILQPQRYSSLLGQRPNLPHYI